MAITVNTLKNLSPRVKVILLIVAYLLIGYFYYAFFLQASLENMAKLQEKLEGLQQKVSEQERIASQKTKYMNEVAALKQAFQIALTKLPDRREIQPLFQSVAQMGKTAGLEFLLFEPKQPEKPPEADPTGVKAGLKPTDKRAEQKPGEQKPAAGQGPAKEAEPEKFYQEIPVKVSLRGRFHNTLSFFEQLAYLPRIVNVVDITMTEGKDAKAAGPFVKTDCIIKTYMFVDKPK
jgi:type IV pilus assembly protein PilO